MKVTCSVIILLAGVAAVLSYPAQTEDKKSSGVGVVKLEKEQRPITLEDIDRETGYGESSSDSSSSSDDDTGIFGYNPFEGLIQSFESMMIQMRRQMAHLLGNLRPGANSTEFDFQPFPQLPFGPDFDLDKGNTTSVTKVIDGHKVVINETEYKDEGANGGSYFKVRIIDVKPDSSEFTTERDAEDVSNNRESLENSSENEILKSNEMPMRSSLMEMFDEVDSGPAKRQQNGDYFNSWDDIEPLYPIENNDIEVPPQVYDLSHDTYVNELLARQGAPVNPDAEVFEVFDNKEMRPLERKTSR